ncbi:MAG: hypothetical protein CVT64_00355 [Actinobacteria bacterium HGW-Actinobacteria-4]|nr:MAG: hypothetical protein CVT64_00355 [Actinobacteria bacterium HGW-Actinobacteria-4]
MSQSVYRAPREWARVHPVSPILGGWAVFAAIAGGWFYTSGPQWLTGSPVEPGEFDDFDEFEALGIHPALVIVAAVLVVAIIVGLSYLSWYFTQYRIGDDAVYQRSGVISRKQRQARLNRLQAVDVVQPLLARIFGFAKLRIEVAGGEGSATEIAFLRLGDADALRNEILVLAAGHAAPVAADAGAVAEAAQAVAVNFDAPAPSLRDLAHMPEGVPAIPSAAEREMYAVHLGRLVGSMVLSWPFVVMASIPIIVVMAVFVWDANIDQAVAVAVSGGFVTAIPVVAGVLGYFWSILNSGFGFAASISQDGIRLRHGLLETRRQTVPPGRVQAVHLKQSLLWRRKDWWRITINVAGYQDETAAVSTLLPVGTRQDALTALWLVLPDMGDPDPASTISRAMSGTGADGGFTPSPRRSMVYDLLQWRFRGVKATDKALLIRHGWLVKEIFVVPHERTQSLSLKQGPLQRALRLASIEVHSTKGPVIPVADQLAVVDAIELLTQQAERARRGRQRQTPEQWMAAVGLAEEQA